MPLAGIEGKSCLQPGICKLDYGPGRCVAEVIIIRDNTVKMSYLSKKNSRKGASDVTSDLNPDPAKAKGLSSLPFYFDL